MSDNATFQLPRDMIEGAIQHHVGLAVSKALGDHSVILGKLIQSVLTQRVDSDGKPSNYSHNAEFITWATNNAVRKAVVECLNEEIKKYEGQIRSNLSEQLAKRNSPLIKNLVESMTRGMVDAASSKWHMSVEIKDR